MKICIEYWSSVRSVSAVVTFTLGYIRRKADKADKSEYLLQRTRNKHTKNRKLNKFRTTFGGTVHKYLIDLVKAVTVDMVLVQ